MAAKKTALVLIADGSEEMEAVIAIDVLRRAEVEVVVAGVDGDRLVECSRGVKIQPDGALWEVRTSRDLLVLPGGRGGAESLAANPSVGDLLRRYEAENRLVGVICAAPMALAKHGVFEGRRVTSHPSVRELVDGHARWVDEPVVRDGQLTTSQGPGTAFLFALSLVEQLRGADVAREVRGPMMFPA